MSSETATLETLDAALRDDAVRTAIDAIVARVEADLRAHPENVMAYEPIPLDLYTAPLPEGILSSWVFILRADVTTGAERHPNSHQRMMSYRGAGDFQTRTDGPWQPHLLASDPALPLMQRWISIPPSVWHQGIVGPEHWAVVSFQTALAHELIEERPTDGGIHSKRYLDG